MRKKNRIIFLGTILIVFFGYYFLNAKYQIAIPCIFHELTDLYCPGCGITRMFFSLIQLNFYQAFRYNPLVFCLLILFLLYKGVYLLIKKIYKIEINLNSKVYGFLLILTIGFGILRNIPIFYFLKPMLIK